MRRNNSSLDEMSSAHHTAEDVEEGILLLDVDGSDIQEDKGRASRNMETDGDPGRMAQCWMLLGTRVVVQCLRLVWVPLLVYISKERELSTIKTGSVLSSFSLGYLSTQLLGGMAADRFGGKPVQTLTMLVMAVGMCLAPMAVDTSAGSGATPLWFLYFTMGLFAGPQHPGYNAMIVAWFPQHELGKVSAICEAGPVFGNLLALGAGPAIASSFGWRHSYYAFGLVSLGWLALWQCKAASNPVDLDSQIRKGKPSKPFPWKLSKYAEVWAVMGQHTVFNGTKYFFADWMPVYCESPLAPS